MTSAEIYKNCTKLSKNLIGVLSQNRKFTKIRIVVARNSKVILTLPHKKFFRQLLFCALDDLQLLLAD